MKKALSLILSVLVAAPVSAQSIQILDNTQKTAYASPAEWVSPDTQCHWRSVGVLMPGHIHLKMHIPLGGLLFGPQIVDFTLMAFMFPGVVGWDSPEGVTDIVFDDGLPVTSPRRGDPSGLVQWHGHLTLDPRLPTRWHTENGGWAPLLTVSGYFDNGDFVNLRAIPGFYVILDGQPPSSHNGFMESARCTAKSAINPDVRWGDNIVETSQWLPIAPIFSPWTNWMETAGYGAQGLPQAHFEERANIDLHNMIPGDLIKEVIQDGDINTSVTFDPVQLGSGPHKIALIRKQVSLDGTEELDTLLTYDVTVGEGVPPPPPEVCGNGIDDDGDGLIDEGCTITPPQPHLIIPYFLRSGDTLFTCDASDNKCQIGTMVNP